MKIALVGTGYSARRMLDEIKSHQVIMTCSRAHDTLLNRGVVPTYHVDIDPGEHKIPRRIDGRVQYLLGDSIHPSYRALVPNAQRAPSGGVQAGDTCILAAAGLGYTELHCYGFDACGIGQEFQFDGRTFLTNENLLGSIVCFEQACQSQRDKGIKVTVHGDGLLRAYLDKKYGIPNAS